MERETEEEGENRARWRQKRKIEGKEKGTERQSVSNYTKERCRKESG